jgi:hypothetical protein
MRLVLFALLGLASLGAVGPGATTESRSSGPVWVADRPPLGAVLRQIEERWPGRALTARTFQREGRPLYQIKWLGTDGQMPRPGRSCAYMTNGAGRVARASRSSVLLRSRPPGGRRRQLAAARVQPPGQA